MMSSLEPTQPALFTYHVNLERRVPADHPLRRVKQVMDLSFVEPAVKHTYGRCGNPSLPPQTLVRMMFLLFFYNIPSERELVNQISVRLDFLWFLDLDLESAVPHHSVLSKARARWGSRIFEQLFTKSIEQCVKAGLVDGQLLHVDSTIVAANASKDSVVTGSPELIDALRKACRAQEQKLELLPPAQPSPGRASAAVPSTTPSEPPAISLFEEPVQSTAAAAQEEAIAAASGQQNVAEVSSAPAAPAFTIVQRAEEAADAPKSAASKIKAKPSGGGKVNDSRLSLTDPDAQLARDKSGVTRLTYKEHRLVDDTHGVITAVRVTHGNSPDGAQLPALYEQHQSHTQFKLAEVTMAADKHYGTASNYRYCAQQNIRPHLGEATSGMEERGLFTPEKFRYDAEKDRFECPAGNWLVLHQRRPEINCNNYLIERAELCLACPLRNKCTKSKAGRSLQAPSDYQIIEKAKKESRGPAARRSRKRRKHVMEGSFADASNNHGSKRARWRRIWRQEIQCWMIAVVQNLRILIKRTNKNGNNAAGALNESRNLFRELKTAAINPGLSEEAPYASMKLRADFGQRFYRALCCAAPTIRWRKTDLRKVSWATDPHVGWYA